MIYKLLNLIVGLFGYEYKLVDDPYKHIQLDLTEEEDWNELIETPRYELVKKHP